MGDLYWFGKEDNNDDPSEKSVSNLKFIHGVFPKHLGNR